jgi:hypothetical protein
VKAKFFTHNLVCGHLFRYPEIRTIKQCQKNGEISPVAWSLVDFRGYTGYIQGIPINCGDISADFHSSTAELRPHPGVPAASPGSSCLKSGNDHLIPKCVQINR